MTLNTILSIIKDYGGKVSNQLAEAMIQDTEWRTSWSFWYPVFANGCGDVARQVPLDAKLDPCWSAYLTLDVKQILSSKGIFIVSTVPPGMSAESLPNPLPSPSLYYILQEEKWNEASEKDISNDRDT